MSPSIPNRKPDPVTVDRFCADALGRAPAAPEVRYPTGLGALTFEELVRKTQRIAGNRLRQGGMDNPDDIDDALQSAYLKLYRRLQQDPKLYAGKPKCYIVQDIFFRSKAQRYAQFRHYHKLVFDADPDWLSAEVGLRSARVDFRIDLEAALEQVVAVIEASDRSQLLLLILYCVLTQAQPCEVAPLFESSAKTFTKHVRTVRALLQAYLPNYRPERPRLEGVRERAQRTLAQPYSGALVCDRYLNKPANRAINDLSGFEQYLAVPYDQPLLQRIRAHERFGEIVAAVARKVAHNARLLLALYVETTSVTQRAVAELFGIGHHAFGRREGRLIRSMIAAEFQAVTAG
jgi:DNA-directed RNA polymerase specialized sigma24 family protein